MSAATPGTGLGLRPARADMARSSFYAITSGQRRARGPKPAISDQALLVAIEADLSIARDEGYRKVWARLRVSRHPGCPQAGALSLSIHRCRRRGGNPHDGEIITHAPNLMWGTDGVRVFTVDDGWGWIFTAVEHWNAECAGWHAASAATASPPCSRSPWGLPGCMARPRPARLGGWPCGWITAPGIW